LLSNSQLIRLFHCVLFCSEFGCVGWSSFESISAQLPSDQWSLHSAASYYRNWPVDNVIVSYFGPQDLSSTGEAALKKQLYQSMIGQGLFMKTEIEGWRSSNVFGTIIWMFNELWPTGGWGSVEYGGPTDGQVSGGRWKPLHYFFAASVYADQMASCDKQGACFCKNDAPFAFKGKVQLTLLNMLTAKSIDLPEHDVDLSAGAGITHWWCASGTASPTPPPAPPAPPPATTYTKHPNQIPTGQFTKEITIPTGHPEACEAACSAEKACLGFTEVAADPTACWLYSSAPSLMSIQGDDWYQKPGTAPISSYEQHRDQIPSDRLNYTTTLSGTIAACEAACDVDKLCIGFTEVAAAPTTCWLYSSAPSLSNTPGDDWYQKPGTPPIPAPKPPPPPPPTPPPAPPCPPAPAPLVCTPWQSTAQWATAGCDATGSNCVLTARMWPGHPKKNQQVAGRSISFAPKSINVLPFQPPKAMHLPNTTVTVSVGKRETGGTSVALTLNATAPALFVVLSTKAAGRFSQNAFLLQAGDMQQVVDFLPWGDFGAAEEALLRSTIRAEHLAENL
jgi:hypothetical protein